MSKPTGGEIRRATVVQVTEDGVRVSVEGLPTKTEPLLPMEEFDQRPAEGEVIPVWVVPSEDGRRPPQLSHRRARRHLAWNEIEKSRAEGTPLRVTVSRRLEAGYEVDAGVPGFLPGSQSGVSKEEAESLVGSTIEVLVLEADRRRRNLVVSRKIFLEQEEARRKKEILQTLKPGDRLRGRITGIAPFGLFVDIGGYEALAPRAECDWLPVEDLKRRFRIGEEMEFQVLEVDSVRERVRISRRPLMPNPWRAASARLKPGGEVEMTVRNLRPEGADLATADGLPGFLPRTELDWIRTPKHPSEMLERGQTIRVRVFRFRPERGELVLSLRRMTKDPLTDLKTGQIVEAEVARLLDFGAFLRLPNGLLGFLPVSELDTQRVEKPSDLLKVGQKVRACITAIHPEKRRLELSVRRLLQREQKELEARYKKGTEKRITLGDLLEARKNDNPPPP